MRGPPVTKRAIESLSDLQRAGLIPAPTSTLQDVADTFRIRMTPEMHKAGDAAVNAQFVPTEAEAVIRPEELYDPIGDAAFSPTAGLTHRYPDRVILHSTQTCEVYCRFCFRREGVGQEGALPDADMEKVLAYLRETSAVREVILTGGDPMVLSPRRIARLMQALAAIPHVDVIRFHTRVPVVAPQRITEALIEALDVRPAVFVVVHTNHAAEITEAASEALRRLTRAGIPLLSQSVLLRGINDDAQVLADLFRTLVRNRVKPYYLHHCDLARGTSHFRTTIAEGQKLMQTLRGDLSGIAMPTYVIDIPGGHGKVPLVSDYLTRTGTGRYRITDWRGGVHDYADPPREDPTSA
ncbi:lysine-2,3-aminomutase-like protein [Falsirhodobacter sp. alg1]|uniref:lysine-2,3-aminomutase-like protein n=1 Tax=Falsirhodobacter sp. alg1 TaxID=1472418 RepID=UPI0005EF8A84